MPGHDLRPNPKGKSKFFKRGFVASRNRSGRNTSGSGNISEKIITDQNKVDERETEHAWILHDATARVLNVHTQGSKADTYWRLAKTVEPFGMNLVIHELA